MAYYAYAQVQVSNKKPCKPRLKYWFLSQFYLSS